MKTTPLGSAAVVQGLSIQPILLMAGEEAPTTAEIRRAALQWGTGRALEVRRDDRGWEVDVARVDGSLVEVTIGDDLELQQLDEERGPDGDIEVDLRRRNGQLLEVGLDSEFRVLEVAPETPGDE